MNQRTCFLISPASLILPAGAVLCCTCCLGGWFFSNQPDRRFSRHLDGVEETKIEFVYVDDGVGLDLHDPLAASYFSHALFNASNNPRKAGVGGTLFSAKIGLSGGQSVDCDIYVQPITESMTIAYPTNSFQERRFYRIELSDPKPVELLLFLEAVKRRTERTAATP